MFARLNPPPIGPAEVSEPLIFPPALAKVMIVQLDPDAGALADNGFFRGEVPHAYVSPHIGHAFRLQFERPFHFFAVVFQPGAFHHVFPFPLREWQDLLLPIDEIHDPAMTAFGEKIREAPSAEVQVALANAYFLARLDRTAPLRSYGQLLVQRIIAAPAAPIHDLTQYLPKSERQLRRMFAREIGTTPKGYQQQVRLAKAMNLLAQMPPRDQWEVALACGYFDTSHMGRAFRQCLYTTPEAFQQKAFAIAKTVMYKHEAFSEAE